MCSIPSIRADVDRTLPNAVAAEKAITERYRLAAEQEERDARREHLEVTARILYGQLITAVL